jgi:hypothetical protein
VNLDALWAVAIGLALVAAGFWLRQTAFYGWTIYGGTPLWRPGLAGTIEVMTLKCIPGGVRVGIGLNATDEVTALTVSVADAERLADLLEQAADAFEAQAGRAR